MCEYARSTFFKIVNILYIKYKRNQGNQKAAVSSGSIQSALFVLVDCLMYL